MRAALAAIVSARAAWPLSRAACLLLLFGGCARVGFSSSREASVAADRALADLGSVDRAADSQPRPDLAYCTGPALTRSPFAGGDGSAGSPFAICTPAQLAALAGRDGFFVLMADLDLTGTAWTPIGTVAAPFLGHLEGNLRSIRGLDLTAHVADSYRGLFGALGGTVKRLELSTALVKGASYVGVLAGTATGATIEGCMTSGVVDATGSLVGGLVGQADAKTVITGSSSSASVRGAGQKIAGLVGMSFGTITRSSASGRVEATTKPGCVWAGGLVGENYGTISRSFATGEVVAASAVGGGLVGWSRNGTISDCYATGDVQVGVAGGNVPGCTVDGAGGYGGGLIGVFMQGTLERCYATGSVTVTGTAAGGLIAIQFVGINQTGSPVTRDSFAVGKGKAADAPGGLIAGLVSGTQGNSYWDKALSQIPTMCTTPAAAGCDDTHGIDTAAVGKVDYFRSKANPPLSAWDFSAVWEESPGGYPLLR